MGAVDCGCSCDPAVVAATEKIPPAKRPHLLQLKAAHTLCGMPRMRCHRQGQHQSCFQELESQQMPLAKASEMPLGFGGHVGLFVKLYGVTATAVTLALPAVGVPPLFSLAVSAGFGVPAVGVAQLAGPTLLNAVGGVAGLAAVAAGAPWVGHPVEEGGAPVVPLFVGGALAASFAPKRQDKWELWFQVHSQEVELQTGLVIMSLSMAQRFRRCSSLSGG